MRDSESTYWLGLVKRQEGYALVYVLLLVAVLSITSALILKDELIRHETTSRTVDYEKALYAARDGIDAALPVPLPSGIMDTSFSVTFQDSAHAVIKVYRWGLYEGVLSTGISNGSKALRVALVAARLTGEDEPAFVLGNLQHGLVLAGNAEITGDILVGPNGASTGDLQNEIQPPNLPIRGHVIKFSQKKRMIDTGAVNCEVAFAKSLLFIHNRRRLDTDPSGNIVDTTGYLDLSNLSQDTHEVFSTGNLTLAGSIMRRGPPLEIVVLGSLTFLPGLDLNGFIAVVSRDSILIPTSVKLNDCIIVSFRSISLDRHVFIRAQLFSPLIVAHPGSFASYPSDYVSTGFSDSSGVRQSITLFAGARIQGAVMMNVGRGLSPEKSLIDLQPGAVVVGDVWTNGYLTMDGTVDGQVRALDLYFYKSPTKYFGWLRQGTINRRKLPGGFLNPIGISDVIRKDVLAWL